MFDYFYGAQSDQFSFYRVPKVMFTDPAFQNVSAEAKILYGLFLDRMGLSARNNWVDEQGRVYIIYQSQNPFHLSIQRQNRQASHRNGHLRLSLE